MMLWKFSQTIIKDIKAEKMPFYGKLWPLHNRCYDKNLPTVSMITVAMVTIRMATVAMATSQVVIGTEIAFPMVQSRPGSNYRLHKN